MKKVLFLWLFVAVGMSAFSQKQTRTNFVNRKKIARIEQTQYFAKNLEVFREKYNKEKVSLWTGFTGEKFTKFMNFCKLDFNFVVESLETQIIESVQQCVKNFKEK